MWKGEGILLFLLTLFVMEKTSSLVHGENAFPLSIFSNCVLEYIRISTSSPPEFLLQENSIPKLLKSFDPDPKKRSWLFHPTAFYSLNKTTLTHLISIETRPLISSIPCHISLLDGTGPYNTLAYSFYSILKRKISPNLIIVLSHLPLTPYLTSEMDYMRRLAWMTSSFILLSLDDRQLHSICDTCSDSPGVVLQPIQV